jgi:hypothetical protein
MERFGERGKLRIIGARNFFVRDLRKAPKAMIGPRSYRTRFVTA